MYFPTGRGQKAVLRRWSVVAVCAALAVWAKRRGLDRSLRVLWQCSPLLLELAWSYCRGHPLAAVHDRWAALPYAVCVRMGGYYTKVGQCLAGVPNSLPAPYLRYLRRLCDNAPARPFVDVRRDVEAALGTELSEVFTSFETTPLGSASIAQAHRAVWKETGAEVAVKVVDPAAARYFYVDYCTLVWLLRRVNPPIAEILSGFQGTIEDELCMRHEATNLQVASDSLDTQLVRCPTPLVGGDGVLVMSYCCGRSIASMAAVDVQSWSGGGWQRLALAAPTLTTRAVLALDTARRLWTRCRRTRPRGLRAFPPNRRIVDRLVSFYNDALFTQGVFNPDCHPGNVLYDEATDTVSLIDFGQLTRIDADDRRRLADVVRHARRRDWARAGCALGHFVTWEHRMLGTVNDDDAVEMMLTVLGGSARALADLLVKHKARSLLELMHISHRCYHVDSLPVWTQLGFCIQNLRSVALGLGLVDFRAWDVLLSTGGLECEHLPTTLPPSGQSIG